jgi:hypothetical protein
VAKVLKVAATKHKVTTRKTKSGLGTRPGSELRAGRWDGAAASMQGGVAAAGLSGLDHLVYLPHPEVTVPPIDDCGAVEDYSVAAQQYSRA